MEQVISVSPVVLPAPGRGIDLQVRISAPIKGAQLPVILFAHGFGNSLDGYAPLVNYWAARGFVVIQPSFLDSKRIGVSPDDPRTPDIWKIRVADMKQVLDQLDDIIDVVPGLQERVDTSRIAAVGHSFGAHTSGLLLGMRVIGEEDDMSDARVQVGVLLTAAGNGGADLSPFAAANYPFMNPDFSGMKKPALVVAGDKDISPLTVRGWDWFTDPYTMSPGPKSLLTLYGGEHLLGGISGYHVVETSDENPERVAAVQQLTWAYLRTAFYPEDTAWQDAAIDLTQGKIDNKGDL
ncbi:alpha/beta hydrolase family protein [Chitinophaga sancti]|uniref:Alpha/beta fold hydrolase n=1 Tax=Chitinophaga sancti TaxID=1004 RepID=A0A1K1S165_9BACT|nr:alpha/beta fold hydrolase [Chitinophaga sancti]WQD59761.1 alpha/beta fold hydrolase [Chitinophaga sancti]WQG88108.1 alpha/beta fold hydrolase [Chitinophaga sancti]SFW77898.1 Alpha/beta hydrolase family protein [Chitinophaga sancti]